MNISEKNEIPPVEKWFRKKWFRDVILFSLTVLWFGTMARFGFDPHHDGVMLAAAAALAEGKLIFKEVFCQYGPLSVLIQSIPVRIWGAEDLVIKFTTVVFYGLSAVVGTRIWERFLEKPFIWCWYGCFFMLCPFYLVPFHPWSSVYALFFMLLGVEGQLRFFETGKPLFLWGAGACAVAAFLCRTPCGLVAFGAGTAILLLRAWAAGQKKEFRPWLSYAGGAGVVSLILALYLTIAGAWGDYFRQCYSFIWGFVVKRGGSWSWTLFSDSMLPLTGSAGLGNCIFGLLPFFVIAAVLIAVRPFFYGKREQLLKNLPLLAILLLALGSWHQYFPVPCVRHLYWGAIPAFGVLGLAARGIWHLRRSYHVRVFLLVLLAVPLLYCFHLRVLVGMKYFENLPERVTGTVPGLRGAWIFAGEEAVFRTLDHIFRSLPPEIRRRGVINHTPDGLYSAVLPPPVKFRHPMFVNWGDDVYPDYDRVVAAYLQKERPVVFSTEFTEIPGYFTAFGFKHYDKSYRLFVPIN